MCLVVDKFNTTVKQAEPGHDNYCKKYSLINVDLSTQGT